MITMISLAVYASLFGVAFIAATVFPLQSEAALIALLLNGQQPGGALLAVASVVNVLGSVVTWVLGRGIERFRDRRWFPASPAALERAQRAYQKWGKWSLLLSWAPFIGDPLTVMAGVLREPLPMFVLLVTMAKAGRYATLAWLVLY